MTMRTASLVFALLAVLCAGPAWAEEDEAKAKKAGTK